MRALRVDRLAGVELEEPRRAVDDDEDKDREGEHPRLHVVTLFEERRADAQVSAGGEKRLCHVLFGSA